MLTYFKTVVAFIRDKMVSKGSIGRLVGIFVIVSGIFGTTGCSESAEEKAFRQALIDKAVNDDTRKAGNAFLAENAKKPSVVVLDSGLQYEVLKAASSSVKDVQVTMAKGVEVHYRGETIEGKEFESTLAGEAVRLEVRKLLKGWQIALLKMKPGDHWRIYLPADLAYGARSPSELIPANSALIFELELFDTYSLEAAN